MSEPQKAVLSRWYKNDGDFVRVDEPICEIETDKATAEFVAWKSGRLQRLVAEGETVLVGAEIARIT